MSLASTVIKSGLDQNTGLECSVPHMDAKQPMTQPCLITDGDFKAMVIFLLDFFGSLLSKLIYHEHLLLLENNKNFI